jgi:hypothetical protein
MATPSVIPCDNCGAPLPIALEADRLRCEHCDHEHPVSAKDRKRMRRIVKELRRTDAVSNAAEEVRRLLLRSALARLFLTGWLQTLGLLLLLALGWALGFMASGLLTVPGVYERGNGFLLATLPLPSLCLLLTLLLLTLYRGRQVRDLRAAAAARPPLAPDGPLRCRICAADLPADAGRGFVRCEHCQTQNLLDPAHVQRREQLVRSKANERLERLRTAEKKVAGALGWAALALVAAPPALGLCLNPIHGTLFTLMAPLLEPPPEPAPWTELYSRLALLPSPNGKNPWQVVRVLEPEPTPRVRVRHRDADRVVAAAKLRQLPLRPGLRVVDPSRPERGVGVLSDELELRFPGTMLDYDDLERDPDWTRLAVPPTWGRGTWQPAPPRGTRLVLIRIALDKLRGAAVWARSVEACSSQRHGSARQVLGPPEQQRQPWVPAPDDEARPDWITVGFGGRVRTRHVVIVELCSARSALVRVDDFTGHARAVPLWRGAGPDLPGEVGASVCVWRLDLPQVRAISALRVHVAGTRSLIDAVGLIPAPER